jgi:hypothetical protein
MQEVGGSIPPGSTKVVCEGEQDMHKFGMISLYLGLVLTAIGLIGGFGMMWAGNDAWAKPLIAMVPVGFLLMFTGIVTTLLHSPRSGSRPKGPPE